MTTKYTDANGKVIYTDAPHRVETGAYDEDPMLRPWLNIWFGECNPGVERDDFQSGQRLEMLRAPVTVEVLS